MLNLAYNPFDCELNSLKTSDLQKLKQIAEGWYVEYKRELITTRKIAKSLAAFANHYGGWIFYGVQESDDGNNLADAFPGLDADSISCLIASLKNAAKDIITPAPYYEYLVLDGPCTEIDLPDDRSIVVVVVPSGPDAPYIHSDGRIYRRVADSSDPKPETDRFILDQLWQRRQQAHAKLSSFLEATSILSEGEDNSTLIDLFLLPDPLEASGQRSELTIDEFIGIMSDRTAPGISLSFDNFFTMAGGIIGRSVNVNDPYNLVLTWRFFSNGFSVISIPMSSATIGSIKVGSWLNGYEQEQPFVQQIQRDRHSSNFILDVNTLVFLMIGAIAQQRRLMRGA